MKEITLPVTIHPNIHLLLPLVQPEPADTDSRPETQHYHGCGGGICLCPVCFLLPWNTQKW